MMSWAVWLREELDWELLAPSKQWPLEPWGWRLLDPSDAHSETDRTVILVSKPIRPVHTKDKNCFNDGSNISRIGNPHDFKELEHFKQHDMTVVYAFNKQWYCADAKYTQLSFCVNRPYYSQLLLK